jgi:hypothetical protein
LQQAQDKARRDKEAKESLESALLRARLDGKHRIEKTDKKQTSNKTSEEIQRIAEVAARVAVQTVYKLYGEKPEATTTTTNSLFHRVGPPNPSPKDIPR